MVCFIIVGDLKVTLLTFSGRPNPKWVVEVNSKNYMLIQNKLTLERNKGFAYHPDGIPNKLGYRGFLVKDTRSQTEDLKLFSCRSIYSIACQKDCYYLET